MRALRIKRPSLGTVLGLTALIVAVVGTANADQTRVIIRKGNLAKGAVTARALAKGAVKQPALANGAVTSKAVAKGAVGTSALTADAVTAGSLAPGSVYGGSLGTTALQSALIADTDEVAENGKWTPSSVVIAACPQGERLLTGGVLFTDPGNNEVAIVKSAPTENGWVGQITSNAGGAAKAEVQAVCLK